MKIRIAPWRGPWFWMHTYLTGIALCNFLNGLIGLLTLGTISLDHNYWNLADKGMDRLEKTTGEFCHCEDCKNRRGELKRMTRDQIDAKMKQFQQEGTPIEEVRAFFEKHGIGVDIMPMAPMGTEPKKETFH